MIGRTGLKISSCMIRAKRGAPCHAPSGRGAFVLAGFAAGDKRFLLGRVGWLWELEAEGEGGSGRSEPQVLGAVGGRATVAYRLAGYGDQWKDFSPIKLYLLFQSECLINGDRLRKDTYCRVQIGKTFLEGTVSEGSNMCVLWSEWATWLLTEKQTKKAN